MDRESSEELGEVDLAEILQHCAHTVCLRYRLPPTSVQLDLSPCIVRMGQIDLDMVFRNLIDNAVKYAGSPPDVHVSLKNVNRQARVMVSDNGPGIPRKLRRKIFGRFVRLGSELERETPGTGLGLYIVRTLVRRQKGRIHVRDRPGGGTVFDVELPGVTAAQDEAVLHETEQTKQRPSGQLKSA